MYSRIIDAVIRHPLIVIILLLAITPALGRGIPNLQQETRAEFLIPADDPARKNLDMLDEIFGSDYFSLILILNTEDPDGIYNPGTLALVEEINDWLTLQPEFETSLNSDLRSLMTANNITSDELGMVVAPFMEGAPATRQESAELRQRLDAMPMYRDMLVARDGKGTLLMVRESAEGAADREATYLKVRAYLDSLNARGARETMYITGRTIVEGLFNIYLGQEGRRMIPICMLMLSVVLYVAFRTPRAVVIPLVVIVMTQTWMLGLHALAGRLVYSITSLAAILIIAVAAADAIHVLVKYYEAAGRPGAEREGVVRETMLEMGPPIFLTSLTTVVGFLSMSGSNLPPVSEFGSTLAAGIISAYLISILFIPAILVLLPLQPPRIRRGATQNSPEGWLDRILSASVSLTTSRPRLTVATFALILLIGAGGVTRLTTDSSMVGQFPPGHHMRQADAIANRHFNGGTDLDLIIDSGRTGGVKNPDLLRRLDAVQQGMENIEIVGDTFSIAELMKHMNRVMHNDLPEHETVPTSEELVAQYLLLYSMSGDPGDFDDLVDYDYRYAHLNAFIRDSSTLTAKKIIVQTQTLIDEQFSEGEVEVLMTGRAHISSRLEEHVNWGQVQTILIATPLLFAIGWLAFGKPSSAALALAPVTFSLVTIYGLMGHFGLPTDIGTTMLAGMALGIGVDFAIHYLHKYRSCMARGHTPTAAAQETALTAGRAIYYNAVVLCGGFLVMLGSRFYPQMKLGALVSAVMIICYFSTMYLFPATLSLLNKPATER